MKAECTNSNADVHTRKERLFLLVTPQSLTFSDLEQTRNAAPG